MFICSTNCKNVVMYIHLAKSQFCVFLSGKSASHHIHLEKAQLRAPMADGLKPHVSQGGCEALSPYRKIQKFRILYCISIFTRNFLHGKFKLNTSRMTVDLWSFAHYVKKNISQLNVIFARNLDLIKISKLVWVPMSRTSSESFDQLILKL